MTARTALTTPVTVPPISKLEQDQEPQLLWRSLTNGLPAANFPIWDSQVRPQVCERTVLCLRRDPAADKTTAVEIEIVKSSCLKAIASISPGLTPARGMIPTTLNLHRPVITLRSRPIPWAGS